MGFPGDSDLFAEYVEGGQNDIVVLGNVGRREVRFETLCSL